MKPRMTTTTASAALALLSLVFVQRPNNIFCQAWSIGNNNNDNRRNPLNLVFRTEQVPSDAARTSGKEKVPSLSMQESTVRPASSASKNSKDSSSSSTSSSSLPATQSIQADDGLDDDLDANNSRPKPPKSRPVDRAAQLSQEADDLRRRAKKLMAEAMEMEADMKEAMAERAEKSKKDAARLVENLFDNGRPQTADAVAFVMRNERVSVTQAKAVVEQLFRQLWEVDYKVASNVGKESTKLVHQQSSSKWSKSNNDKSSFSGDNVSEAATVLLNRLDCVIEAADILDRTSSGEAGSRWSGRVASSLKSHLSELRTMTVAQTELAEKQAIAEHLERRHNLTNNNNNIEEGSDVTAAIPSSSLSSQNNNIKNRLSRISYFEWLRLPKHLRKLWTAQPSVNHTIAAEDVELIQTKVLNGTSFVWNSTETIASTAAYFRGTVSDSSVTDLSNNVSLSHNARAQENVTAHLFQELNARMKKEGLDSRVNLFLLNDPKKSVMGDLFGGSSESENKATGETSHPVIMAVPATIKPVSRPRSMLVNAIRQLLLAWPVLTLFSFSVRSYALNPSFFQAIVQRQDARALSACAPIFLGIVGIQMVHELAHWWVAKRKGIKISWPFPIPSFELGTFGCITGLKSFPANRTDMFDFSMSGPVAAAMSSLACMLVGVHRTLHASSQTISTFPTLPVAWFKSSFLSGAMLSVVAPKILTLPLSQPIPIHPLFVIGFSGLLSSALNLLPVTRLDGGRAATAAMGRYGEVASLATFLCVLISMIFKDSASSLLWSWIMFVVLFQRQAEIPSRDDYTEINNFRLNLWVMSVVFSVLTLVPFPGYKSMAPTGL